MTEYFPNTASNGMSIALSNFQFPIESTCAVLVLIVFRDGSLSSIMTVELGDAVPKRFILSPLMSIVQFH